MLRWSYVMKGSDRFSLLLRDVLIPAFVASVLLLPVKGNTFGDIRFKNYNEDRNRLENYIERGKDASDMAQWDVFVQSGKETMEAEWERDADFKIDRIIREEGDTPNLRMQLERKKEEAFAEWERAVDAKIADEAGEWYARRQSIFYKSFDMDRFRNALEDTVNIDPDLSSQEKIDKWDLIINTGVGSITSDWEDSLDTTLASLSKRAGDLAGARREAFLREADRIEEELRDRFRLERNQFVLRERNHYVTDLLIDSDSLRRISEDKSANAITNSILSDAIENIKAEEKMVLRRDADAPGEPSAIDFSRIGSNWEEEMQRLVERGLEKWKQAQGRLYEAMREWKENAENVSEEGERIWQEAYERLVKEREEWQENIREEIDNGLFEWQRKEAELNDNITRSRRDLLNYLAVQQRQWETSSRGLREMAVLGSRVYREAINNVDWLSGMSSYYRNRGFYHRDVVSNVYYSNRGLVQPAIRALVEQTVSEGRQIYPYEKAGRKCVDRNALGKCTDHDHFWRLQYGDPLFNVNIVHYNSAYIPEERRVVEKYTFRVSANVAYIWRTHKGDPKASGYVTDEIWYAKTFSKTNIIESGTPDSGKSRYYYYVTENKSWGSIRDSFEYALDEAESYIHGRNMFGEEGGPGYLVNTDGLFGLKYLPGGELESDPYLMTSAEFDYEYARRELEFWERRLGIAEAVMMYAYPVEFEENEFAPKGKRESAEITTQRKEEAEALLKEARALYSQSLEEVEGIVSELDDQKSLIRSLSSELRDLQTELDAHKAVYADEMSRIRDGIENGVDDATYEELLAGMEKAQKEYEPHQIAYDKKLAELNAAKVRYSELNIDYTDRINRVSEYYRDYREAEYAYEHAYAVWEYANTPYLKDTVFHDGSIGSGPVPGSDATGDYGDMQAPDARENYEYILSVYDTVHEAFLASASALEDQETVEMLALDTEYMGLRDALEFSTMAYMNSPTEENLESRMAALEAYRSYCSDATVIGIHDSTVMLRDQEVLFWELLQYAGNADNPEGYDLILSELVYNGSGTSIDDMIVNSLIQQNSLFKEQAWNQQQVQFNERKSRWIEVVGFIMNRGERDWTNNINDFVNRRREWRIEAKKRIDEGEKEWTNVVNDFNGSMVKWQLKTAEAASEEGSKKIIEEFMQDINGYLAGLNRNLPAELSLDVNAGEVLNRMMSDQLSVLGILSDTMQSIDITAGFTEVLNLDISSALQGEFDDQMRQFGEMMTSMQTVRMGESAFETLQEILKSFNESLAEANKSVSEQIKTDLRDEFDAPFKRGEYNWSIRYISDYSLAEGTEHKTYAFSDYNTYVNTTVFMNPLRGLRGEIDFYNPYTYQNLDIEELQTYIRLENEHLNRLIENVFRDDGLFPTHVKKEFGRLAGGFTEGYKRYLKGKAMKKQGKFNTPIVSGLPSPRMIAQVGASIALTATGNPWAAFALNSAMTAYDVDQGTLDWEHALMQSGVSFASSYVGGLGTGMLYTTASQSINIAASGIEYDEKGNIGWSNENLQEGIKAGLLNLALISAGSCAGSSTFMTGLTTGVRSIIMSGLETDGRWYEFGFDNEHLAEHIIAGTAAGITASLMHQIGEYAGWNKAQLDVEGKPITGARDPFNPNVFMHGYTERAMSGLLNSSLMTLGYNMRDGKGFRNGYSDINWSSMLYTHQDLAGTLGQMTAYETNQFIEGYEKRKDKRPVSENDARKDPLDKAEDYLGGVLLSLRKGAEDVEEIYNAVTQDVIDVFESSVNFISRDGFMTDKEIAVAAAMDEMKEVYGKYHQMVDLQQSRDMWNAGVMDLIVGINRGKIKGVNYSFTGNGEIALYANSNQPVQSAIKHFSIYDLNAASTFGKTGGYKNSALNRNMRELTDRMGASSEEIQELYSTGLLPESVVNAIALTAVEGMSAAELNRFMKSYSIAAGLSGGYIQQRNGGYYDNAGQRVAGEWGESVIDNNTIFINPCKIIVANGFNIPVSDSTVDNDISSSQNNDVLRDGYKIPNELILATSIATSIKSLKAYKNITSLESLSKSLSSPAGKIGILGFLITTAMNVYNVQVDPTYNIENLAIDTLINSVGVTYPVVGIPAQSLMYYYNNFILPDVINEISYRQYQKQKQEKSFRQAMEKYLQNKQ